MAADAALGRPRDRERTHRARRALAASILALAAVIDAAGEDSPDTRIAAILRQSSLDPRTRAGLASALRIAVRKLESSACREILSAFPGAWNTPPPSPDEGTDGLLAGIKFRDGMPYQVCRDSRVLAFTHPGAREVFLCGDQFNRIAFSTPEFAADIVIHEALHTLGLRENPPAPGEITARIAASCHADRPPAAADSSTARSNPLDAATEIRMGGRPR